MAGLKAQETIIKGVAQAVRIAYKPGKLENSTIEQVDGLWHMIVGY